MISYDIIFCRAEAEWATVKDGKLLVGSMGPSRRRFLTGSACLLLFERVREPAVDLEQGLVRLGELDRVAEVGDERTATQHEVTLYFT